MKKVLLIFSVLMLAITLSGCEYINTNNNPVDCEKTPNDPSCEVNCEDTNTCEEPIMKINGIDLISESTIAGELLEFKLDTEGIEENGNVYDSSYVKITMTFEKDGKSYQNDAFWYQPYNEIFNEDYTGTPSGISGQPSTDQEEIQGMQTLLPQGDAEFRVRISLPEVGMYNFSISLKHQGEEIQTYTGQIPVNYESTDYKGFIKINDNRYFAFENEEQFIPVGQNNAWYTSSTRKNHDYQVWFDEMNDAGMNASRVWMATWGFAQEWGTGDLRDYNNRQNEAYRLDQVVEWADDYDIYFLLTILNHGQFSYSTNAEWSKNPWNQENGGILNLPSDFFKNEEAKEIFKDQLRYIVSRWGYSDNILAWELFNEVDWIDNYSDFVGKQWHDEMGTYLKDIDPNHLVTTSVKGTDNFLFGSTVLDFINAHDYGYQYKNINNHLPQIQYGITDRYDSPVWMSEIGVNWENGTKTFQTDSEGVALRQQTWAGALGGGLGGAMNWWWDSYTNPYNLYHQFTGFTVYMNDIDLSGEDFKELRELNTEITYGTGVVGYRIDNRVYAYVYNKDFSHMDSEPTPQNDVVLVVPISDGTYTVKTYNTLTGEVINTETITAVNGTITVTFNQVRTDYGLIIE